MYTTEAPASELCAIELLAKLFYAVNNLRQDVLRHPLMRLPVMTQSQSIEGWLSYVVNSAFGGQRVAFDGDYVVVREELAELIRKHLTDDAYIMATVTKEFKRLEPAGFIVEIMRRHKARPISELRRTGLLTAEALVCVDLSNEGMFDVLGSKLRACVPSAELQYVDPEHNPDWLLKRNLEALGVSHFSTSGKHLIQFTSSAALFSAIELQFGVPGLSPGEGYIYLAPWVQVMLARVERREMDLVFAT